MRIAGLILGILGGLAAGYLGMRWLNDANASGVKEAMELARQLGVKAEELQNLSKHINAAYFLIGSMVLGIVGGVLAFMGKGKIAAALMLIGVILPAVFAPESLVFTCILLIGAIVSFFAKPKAAAPGY